jgi:outer membrane protein OmpA-like peptidoglycan-associated protein
MKNLQLVFCVLCLWSLSGCTNTWEGIKADKRDAVAWSHNKPSSMEKLVGPAPAGYAGSTTRKAIPARQTMPQSAGDAGSFSVRATRAVSPSGLVWHKIDNYDIQHPEMPSRNAAPLSSYSPPQEPVTNGIVEYNQSVNVFPVDGDTEPYTQVNGQNMALSMNTQRPEGDLAEQVFFAHGSAAIAGIDRRNLHELGESLARTTGTYKISVVGHASRRVNNVSDPLKKKMINFEMAQKRANAVTNELRRAGADPSMIVAISKGDTEPNPRPGDRSREAADRHADVYMASNGY